MRASITLGNHWRKRLHQFTWGIFNHIALKKKPPVAIKCYPKEKEWFQQIKYNLTISPPRCDWPGKKESAKIVGITNDYTFLQHQSLPCVYTFANMHRCRGRRMLIGLIFVCTSLCKKCFISIMHLFHYTVSICGGIRFNIKSQNLAWSSIC